MIQISFTRNLFISTLFIVIALLLISLTVITGSPVRLDSEDRQAARPGAMAHILSAVKSFAWLRTPYDGVEDVIVVHPTNWPVDPEVLHEQLRKEMHEQLMITIRKSLNRDRTIGDRGAAKHLEHFFTLYVPANTPVLRLNTNGPLGLYVMRNGMPSTSRYDCRSIDIGTRQSCVIRRPKQGIYYVMLRGNARYYGVSVTGARHTAGHIFPSIAVTPVEEVAGTRVETPNT